MNDVPVIRYPISLLLAVLLELLAVISPVAAAHPRPIPVVEESVQAFLDAQPGPLKTYRDGERSAAELLEGTCAYYGLSPRIVLALLEATGALLSTPTPPDQALRQPFGPHGPDGFDAQIDWAARDLRAGIGPYERPPTLTFTDGTTLTLTLEQAAEGVAVQRFLAQGRSQAEWRAAVERFGQAFRDYFNNELPAERRPEPPAVTGFLRRPWIAGTRVVHLSYFDHMYPTVDTGRRDNGFVVNYLGRGGVQYDGHDGHDFYFPDQPIGTFIYAAADGTAHASTHRGNGVWIEHADGYVTVYWHLDKFASIFRGKINTGQGVAVRAGDLIGSSGKTGFTSGTPHLHFEVRHNGRQVDPYGWYGPGPDPCADYAACEASTWLWHHSLVGEGDFTPPGAAAPDQTPPLATLTVNPHPDLRFLVGYDGSPLQRIGEGTPTLDGSRGYDEGRFGRGLRLSSVDRLVYPTGGNLALEAGTIALWARLPERYPATGTGRNYLFAASAHPDEDPVYTGTLALRRDLLGPGEAPRWNFWTTPDSGMDARDDLAAPDTLGPGLHHFAITWDRAGGTKALYLDGALVAERSGVELPADVGELLEIGRFSPGAGASGVTIDELAIFGRALNLAEVQQIAAAQEPLPAAARRAGGPDLALDVNAMDDAGGIMGVQLGIDGVFGDPQPYLDGYRLRLPEATGTYTIAARFFDRAGNSTTVSATVDLAPVAWPVVRVEDLVGLGMVLSFTPASDAAPAELQISESPDFAGAVWRPLPERLFWPWPASPARVWVRFRDTAGLVSAPQAVGPEMWRVYLPLLAR